MKGETSLSPSKDDKSNVVLTGMANAPGFDSRTRRHIWVAFVVVVGSLALLREVFPRVLRFFSLSKSQYFQISMRSEKCNPQLVLCSKFIDT